jgi:flagellar biosynthesis chaperone FliJ
MMESPVLLKAILDHIDQIEAALLENQAELVMNLSRQLQQLLAEQNRHQQQIDTTTLSDIERLAVQRIQQRLQQLKEAFIQRQAAFERAFDSMNPNVKASGYTASGQMGGSLKPGGRFYQA